MQPLLCKFRDIWGMLHFWHNPGLLWASPSCGGSWPSDRAMVVETLQHPKISRLDQCHLRIYFQLDGKSMCWERETSGCRSLLAITSRWLVMSCSLKLLLWGKHLLSAIIDIHLLRWIMLSWGHGDAPGSSLGDCDIFYCDTAESRHGPVMFVFLGGSRRDRS